MKNVDRLKMCPNCDGRVAHDATQCPYCFTTLQAESHKSTPPPQIQDNFMYSKVSDEPRSATRVAPLEEPETSQSFWPILLLIVGGNLFTLGVLQFIFSDHGTIRLEINGSYWFLMLLVSLPLFYFGLKNLKK